MADHNAPIAPKRIAVRVNGKEYQQEVEPRLLLVDFLREVLGLTATHIGCDTTSCGACTILLDGRSIKSCTFFAVAADGRDILTSEGLAADGKLHPIQEAFWENNGLQCGYCTSGMMMSAYYQLSRNAAPSDREIRRAIAGNLCRCTGYQFIVDSIREAGKKMQDRE